MPAHENSILHKNKNNYIKWKISITQNNKLSMIDNLLVQNISTEVNRWRQILRRVLDVIFLLSERGLAFFGHSQKLEDSSNGNFLGIIQLLGIYDNVL